MSADFFDRIDKMNQFFKISSSLAFNKDRLNAFVGILSEETDEFRTAITDYEKDEKAFPEKEEERELVALVALADCLADHVVYCCSEARRHGFSLLPILQLVMDSQDSKLVDGQPLYNEAKTKVIKGPDFKAPEKLIEDYLLGLMGFNGPDILPGKKPMSQIAHEINPNQYDAINKEFDAAADEDFSESN